MVSYYLFNDGFSQVRWNCSNIKLLIIASEFHHDVSGEAQIIAFEGYHQKVEASSLKGNPRLLFHYPSEQLNISYTRRLSQNIHSSQFLERYTFKLCLMLP
jgi:hypothetical protein